MSKLLLDLAEELDAEEDVFVSLLLLDLASEEEVGFTEELDSFALSSDELEFSSFLEDEEATLPSLEEDFDFSTEEEDFSLSVLFCELEEFLEIFSLLELASSQSSLCSSHWRGSGETEEEDSSPHAASRARRMDRAKAFAKIFTEDLR